MIILFISKVTKKIFNILFKRPIKALSNTKKKMVKAGFSIAIFGCIARKINYLLFGETQKGEIRHRLVEKIFVLGTTIANFGLAIFVLQENCILIGSLLIINSLALLFAVFKI